MNGVAIGLWPVRRWLPCIQGNGPQGRGYSDYSFVSLLGEP
jgi:hypothetical protein